MWDALKQVIRESEIYSKQLVFFVLILAIGSLGFGGFRYVTTENSKPQAATELASNLQPKIDSESTTYDIIVAPDAKVKVNGELVSDAITYEGGRAQFLLVLARKLPV